MMKITKKHIKEERKKKLMIFFGIQNLPNRFYLYVIWLSKFLLFDTNLWNAKIGIIFLCIQNKKKDIFLKKQNQSDWHTIKNIFS